MDRDGSIGASGNSDAVVKKVRVFRVISWIVPLIVEKTIHEITRNSTKMELRTVASFAN